MDKKKVNYGVYLVTDSTPAILGNKDLTKVVEAAVRGGATIVQYRDKHSDREAAVKAARALLEVTRRYGVPLLVNDRVDVAAEIGCEGVHIGQDDMGEFCLFLFFFFILFLFIYSFRAGISCSLLLFGFSSACFAWLI